MGDQVCQYCGAFMLDGESEGRMNQCCMNGLCHTDEMKKEFDELQNPPKEFLTKLVNAKDARFKEQFLNNTLPINNEFSFASVHSENATTEDKGGREDTCKLNGKF